MNYLYANGRFDAASEHDGQVVTKLAIDYLVEAGIEIAHVYDGFFDGNIIKDLLEVLKTGDIVYVWSWRCLPARNSRKDLPEEIVPLFNKIRTRGAELCCIQENIDTASPNDRLTLIQLAAFEQFNLDVSKGFHVERPFKSPRISSPRPLEVSGIAYSGHVGC